MFRKSSTIFVKLKRPRGRAVRTHGDAGSNPAGGEILPEPKRRFITQRLLSSPFHRLEMTEILLSGCKTLTHLSILIKVLLSYAFTVIFIYFAKCLHYTASESSIESTCKTCWSLQSTMSTSPNCGCVSIA